MFLYSAMQLILCQLLVFDIVEIFGTESIVCLCEICVPGYFLKTIKTQKELLEVLKLQCINLIICKSSLLYGIFVNEKVH